MKPAKPKTGSRRKPECWHPVLRYISHTRGSQDGVVCEACGVFWERTRRAYSGSALVQVRRAKPKGETMSKPTIKPCQCKPCKTCGAFHGCNLNVPHPGGWVRAIGEPRCPAPRERWSWR